MRAEEERQLVEAAMEEAREARLRRIASLQEEVRYGAIWLSNGGV